MNTDVKKAVFQAIVSAEDYVQAFENVTRLGLKKQQEREIVKVLIHCCVNEKKLFNKFYGLLASRLCKYDPQSFKYSFKYTLWDYLKSLQNYDLRQIANLAKLFGMLFGAGDLPLHFLKVLDFSNLEDGGKTLTKPQQLFLYLAFDELFTSHPKEDIRKVFLKSLAHSKAKKRVIRGDFDDD
jgi:nucleolar MIF4G domain-containing protein 1